ncbi:acyltransferase family protein [Tropicibacter sp. S64]|uniref:acyltransferase family protein n=1 Tax=Tropicibacter sp. S64 TaxID=3415122 RepID=UPI003C7DC1B4
MVALASTTTTHRDDIQGLRAIAVLSVVLFHAWPAALPGGFVGVDIFFVISGFLITGILARDIGAGRFSLADFYRRRVRRIFPALFVVLAVTLAVGCLLLSPQELMALARNTVTSTLFVSNVDFYLTTGYFGRSAELQPLLHTWSLAVEEQFYILFPPVLWLVMRFARRLLMPLLLLCLVASLGLSEWALGKSPTGAYFLTPFRVFELLIGAALALAPPPSARVPVAALSGLGLVLLAGSVAFIHEGMGFPGLMALLPTLGAGLVLWAGRSGPNAAGALISSRPFLFFGAISYSLYLWHWPVFAFLRIRLMPEHPGFPAACAALALIVSLSWLSYRFVEQPFAKRPITAAPFLRAGLAGMGLMVLAGGGVLAGQGLPGRFPEAALRAFAAEEDFSPLRASCHRGAGQKRPYEKTCVTGAEGTPARVAVWGDSHGVEVGYELGQRLAGEGKALRLLTASSCPPVMGLDLADRPDCRDANAGWLAGLVQDGDIETVVLLSDAVQYLPRVDAQAFEAGFRETVRALTDAGKRVILVAQLPVIGMEAPSVAGHALARGADPAMIGRDRAQVEAEHAAWTLVLADVAALPGVTLYDPLPRLCAPDLCPLVDADGTVLYFDPSHVTRAGARSLAGDLQGLLSGGF